jgi:hypothetical protein
MGCKNRKAERKQTKKVIAANHMKLKSTADVHGNNPVPQIVQQKHDMHHHCNQEYQEGKHCPLVT